ncbi:MAG: DUF3243 family protein [Bacillota bacterium]
MEHISLEAFPKELAAKIQEGQRAGLSDEQIVQGIVNLGNVMSRFVKPDSPEEALMKEMWSIATDDEKRTLAGIVLRMGKRAVH